MFDKCYLKCFLYSVCKDQETIAYKVFTKTKHVMVWSVLSQIHKSCIFVHYHQKLAERGFYSTLRDFNLLHSLLRLHVGG